MGKRLGIPAAVIAVMALVVGAVSPALGSSSQGAASTSSGHADKQQTIRVLAVFTEFDQTLASALRASASLRQVLRAGLGGIPVPLAVP